MKLLLRNLILGILITTTLSCSDDDDGGGMTPPPSQDLPNLVDAAQDAGLTTLLDAVNAVDGLDQTLLNADEITVFAPTNEAFGAALEAFDANNLSELVEAIGGPENLETVLGFHVVPAVAFAGDLAEGEQTFNTLADQQLTVTKNGDSVSVTDFNGNTYDVVTPDVEIENGVVHVIDGVLLPELPSTAPTLVEAAQDAGLTTLLDAVGAVDGLDQTLLDADAITVFAPTNEAFVDALEAFNADDLSELVEAIGGPENLETVLGFHVVPAVAFAGDLAEGEQTFNTLADQELTVTKDGDSVSVTDPNGNTYNVVTPDVEIENGVVHVIDGVLLPEIQLPNTITDLAKDNNDLSSLVAALEYTGLDETLADRSTEFTVFAPTNGAFASFLDGATVQDLPEEVVTQVLLNHVLTGTSLSSDLETTYDNTLATFDATDNNLSLYINTDNGVTLNGISSVTAADNEASNGVVHVVDNVIELPTVVTFATADPTFNSLEAALTRSDQPDFIGTLSTSNGTDPAPFTVFAPTNTAFSDLLNELGLNDLSEVPQQTLTSTLNSHVVASANVRAADLTDGPVTTLGAELTVDAGNATLTDPNGRVSNIIVTDVQASNGVIHAIDKVVLPQQ